MSGFDAASGKAQPISVARPAAKIEELIESPFPEDLIVAARHGSLNEELALAMLRRHDLAAAAIEALTKNHAVIKHRKILLQVVQHQRTPRHLSVPLLRRLFTFELMHIALTPSVAADVKLVAEEVLIGKLDTLSLGECISLAKQASPGVAGALLLRAERGVVEAALHNPRMTELSIVKSLAKRHVPLLLLTLLVEHPKWGLRRELQLAILRRAESSEAMVQQVASRLPKVVVLEVVKHARLPQGREELLRRILAGS
jgi:hypothetical protein